MERTAGLELEQLLFTCFTQNRLVSVSFGHRLQGMCDLCVHLHSIKLPVPGQQEEDEGEDK